MHPAVVRCTGADFVRDAGQCCTDSAWELRERRDAFGASVQWLEATYPLPPPPDNAAASGAPLLVTVCVLYNASFAVPQLGFHTATVTGLDELQASLPRLTFLNATSAADSCGKAETSRRPLVSFTWSEELGQHVWLVHPCDTERVLRCRRCDGDRGDVLGVFLRAMAGYFPLAPPLLPGSG